MRDELRMMGLTVSDADGVHRPRRGASGALRRWECFCDDSYYHMWAVRAVGERRWGHCYHVPTREEGEGLRDLLNDLEAKARA